MPWTRPQFTHNEVNEAGKVLIDPLGYTEEGTEHALRVINNWRSSHSCPLLVFKNTLHWRARKIDPQAIIAQRIKRIHAIEVKLTNTPSMNLSRMHDIGGCRAVMKNASMVEKLVLEYEKAIAKNPKRGNQFVRCYDYIKNPKPDGYRGVHLVFKYKSQASNRLDFNGLRIEIQLRSKTQHMWATAVETVSAFTGQALKSNIGEDSWKRFFSLISSGFALIEDRPLVPNTPTSIAGLLKEINTFHEQVTLLEDLTKATLHIKQKSGDFFLMLSNSKDNTLNIESFNEDQLQEAQDRYLQVEKEIKNQKGIQAVLVSVDSVAALHSAYPNYFLDVKGFLNIVKAFLGQK